MSQVFGLGLVLEFTDNATAGINAASQAFAGFTQSVANKSTSQSIMGIAKSVSTLGSGLIKGLTIPIGGVATAFAKAGMSRAVFVQQAQFAFQSLMGGAKEAGVYMQDLMAFAKKTPFRYETIVNGAQSLISYGVEAKKAIPIMTAVGDAMGGMGKSQANMSSVLDTLSRINSEGKVSGIRLRQLAMNGIQADKIIGNMHGFKTMEEAQKYLKKMDTSQFLDELTTGLEKGTQGALGTTAAFEGMMVKMKGTWAGAVDSFKSAMTNAGLELMGMYTDADGLIQYKNLDHMTASLNNLGSIVKMIAPLFKPMVDTFFTGLEKASTKAKEFTEGLMGVYNTAKAFKQLKDGEITAEQFANATWGATDKVHGLIEKFKTLNESMNGVPAKFAGMIPQLLGIATAIGPVLLILGKLGAMPVVANALGAAFDVLTGKVVFDAVPAFKEFGTSVMQSGQHFKNALGGFKEAAQGFGQIGSTVLKGFNFVKSLGSPLIGGLKDLGKQFATGVKNLFTSGGVTHIFSEVGHNFLNIFETLAPNISAKLSSVGSAIKSSFSNIVGIGSAYGVLIKDKFTSVWDRVKEVGSAYGVIIGEKFSGIGEKFSTAFNTVSTGVKSALDKTKSFITSGMTAIQSKFSGVGEKFKGVGRILSDTGKEIGSVFSKSFGGFASSVADKFSPVKDKVSNTFSNMLSNVSGNLSVFGNVLSSKFNKAKEPPYEWAEGVSDYVRKTFDLTKGTDIAAAVEQGWLKVNKVTEKTTADTTSKFTGMSGKILNGLLKVGSGAGKVVSGMSKGFVAVGKGVATLVKGTAKLTIGMAKVGAKMAGGALAVGGFLAAVATGGKDIGEMTNNINSKITSFTNGITTAVPQVANMITSVAGTIQSQAPAMLAGFETAATQLASTLPTVFSTVASTISTLLPQITTVATSIISTLADCFVSNAPMLINGLVDIFSSVANSIGTLLPALMEAGGQIISTLVTSIGSNMPAIISSALTIVQGFLQGLLTALPQIIMAGVQFLMYLVQGVVSALPQLMNMATQLIPQFVSTLMAMLPQILTAGMQIIMMLVQGAVAMLPVLIQLAAQIIPQIITGLVSMLPQLLVQGMQIIMMLFQGIVSALPTLISAGLQMIPQIVNGIISALPQLIAAGIQIIIMLVTGIIQAIPQLIACAGQIITGLWDAFTSINWGELGLNIIKGIWDGIKSLGGALWDGITSLFTGGGGGAMDAACEQAGSSAGKSYTNGLESSLSELKIPDIEMPELDMSTAMANLDSFNANVNTSAASAESTLAGIEGADVQSSVQINTTDNATGTVTEIQNAVESLNGKSVDITVGATDNATTTIASVGGLVDGLVGKSVTVSLDATDNITATAGSAKGAVDAIPKTQTTTLQATDSSSSVCQRVTGVINAVPTSRVTTLSAVDSASSTIRSIKSALDSLPSTKTITVKVNQQGEIPHNATGTDFFKGGLSWINEQGGELIDLPRGSTIIPHDQSIVEAMNRGMKMGARALGGYINSETSNTEPVAPIQKPNQDSNINRLARTLSASASGSVQSESGSASDSANYDYSVTFAAGSIVIQAPKGGTEEDYRKMAEYIMKYIDRTQQKKAMAGKRS